MGVCHVAHLIAALARDRALRRRAPPLKARGRGGNTKSSLDQVRDLLRLADDPRGLCAESDAIAAARYRAGETAILVERRNKLVEDQASTKIGVPPLGGQR